MGYFYVINAPILNKTIHKTLDWLYDIEDLCGWEDQRLTLAVLRAVLHELRDLLPNENVAHLSAQLPLLIRGLYFEGWNPTHNPSRERNKHDFLENIELKLSDADYDIPDLEEVIQNVLSVISQKVDKGVIDKTKKVLPKDIRALFEY